MDNVNAYLALVARVVATPTPSAIAAVERFEAEHPGIEDDVYRAAGPMDYEIVSGTVMPR